jgi:hypothetical protein
MKDTTDTRRVANPARQRLATSRKRTLRSCSVRTARSVWSEYQSRVTESRKSRNRRGFSDRIRGNSIAPTATAMGGVTRPGSASGAEVYWGISGTCEGLPLPGSNSGYWRSSSRQGRREGEIAGRLSLPIVAMESRVTQLGRSL